jgi:transposase
MGISRASASKWVNRYRRHGELGLHDLPSTPRRQPTATDTAGVARIEDLRRSQKWPASRIAFELQTEGVTISCRTVSRHLLALGLNHRKLIDPNGRSNRELRKINGRRPGHMVHVAVKKVGRIPDGGGWRAHGRGSEQAKNVERRKKKSGRGATSTFTPPSTGSADSPTPRPCPTRKQQPPSRSRTGRQHGSPPTASPTWNGSSPTTEPATAPTRSPEHSSGHATSGSLPTPRDTTARWSYNRIIAEEFLYAHTRLSEDQRRTALGVWNVHYNYHRPHSGAGGQPPASRLADNVTNVLASYI